MGTMNKHQLFLASALVALFGACNADFESKPCPADSVPDNDSGVCRRCETGTVPDLTTGQCKACDSGYAPDASGQCAPAAAAGSGGSGGSRGKGGQGGSMPGLGGSGGSGMMGGAGRGGGGTVDTGTAHVRIVHLSPDAGPLNVCARRRSAGMNAPFDISVYTSIAYKTMTQYVDVPAGDLDIRLVEAGAACSGVSVAPDNVALDALAPGQFAMLSLAGLRTPAAAGGVPEGQSLASRLFLDPAPTEGAKKTEHWVRFTVFSVKTPTLDVGEYLNDFYESTETFTKGWEPASYGYVATPKQDAHPYGYRTFFLSEDFRSSVGISLSPATSTSRPDKKFPFFEELIDVDHFGNSFGDEYDMFTIGQYASLSNLSILLCQNPGTGPAISCKEYQPSSP